MTIAAIQANAGASVSVLSNNTNVSSIAGGVRLAGSSQQSTTAQSNSAANVGDTVKLSDTAQQYLQSSQTIGPPAKGLVEQLARAAASGDSIALSMLTVV